MTGATLGPYRLDRELGAGGMGKVWRAKVEGRVPGLEEGRVVALKLVHPHLLETPGTFKRFLREAQIGKSVVHENVVRTFDADEIVVAGVHHHILVMEYVEGRTLRALLEELGRVPEALCRHVGREVARGLAAIHAAGVVHRDLKPENVLITKDHAVKVMDLGVAHLADEVLRVSQTGVFVGSVSYAAPEQFRGGPIDGRADLFALGVLLYELATAQHPFQVDDVAGTMRRVLDEAPRRCGEVNPQLSPFFEEFVHQLLAKGPVERFASADETVRVLDEGERSEWWRRRAAQIRTATRRPLRRIRIPRETALYGRDAELAKLRALYEKAAVGEGQAVWVEGEAGIGKSRLVDEFVGLLQREGEDVNYLFGSYPPGGAATASGAFSTAYREHFGDAGLDENLKDRLTAAPLLAPAFAALLRGDATPPGVEPLTRDSVQTCFIHATRALAAERTTIVLIDDLHFAPEEGRSLFAAIALAAPGRRVLFVGTARPGLDEKWLASLDRIGATRISLSRLGPKDLGRLLVDALKSEATANTLALRIATKSDGNPFFVFEILRGLREGQFLARGADGTWVTTRVVAEIRIPSSVLDLVNARVAGLTEEERNALDVASCLGFEFDAALVADVLGTARIPLFQRLAHVEKAHRLVRSAGRRFVFDHHQVQEALYGGLPEVLREEYHAAIGEALERRHDAAAKDPTTLDGALCVDLSEHFLAGAKGARAVRYLDFALTHLERGWLNDAASRLAERALAVPGLLAGAERGKTLRRLADRLDFLGRRERQRAAVEEASALARASRDREGEAAALGCLIRLLHSLGRFDETREACERRLALVREIGDRRGEALGEESLGIVLCSLGRLAEAREKHEGQLALAQELGDRQGEARAMGNLGNVFLGLGRFAEAQVQHEGSLALAREIGDRYGEAKAVANLGLDLRSLGRLAEAREAFERHLAISREIGDRRGEAHALGSLGSLFRLLGRFDEAREHFERRIGLAREIGDRHGEGQATGSLGVVAWSLGRFAEARERLEEYLAIGREVGDRRAEGAAVGNLGIVLGSLGRLPEAREHFDRQLTLAREIGDRQSEAQAAGDLGNLFSSLGRFAEAQEHVERCLALAREIGERSVEAEGLCVRGTLLARTGRIDAARADLEAASALARELSLPGCELAARARLATLPGGDVKAALAALTTHGGRVAAKVLLESRLLLWQTTRDRVHLAEARRLLEDLLAHAPPEDRDAMLANVPVNREIAAACEAEGVA